MNGPLPLAGQHPRVRHVAVQAWRKHEEHDADLVTLAAEMLARQAVAKFVEQRQHFVVGDAGRVDAEPLELRADLPDVELLAGLAGRERRADGVETRNERAVAEHVEPWTYLKFPYLKKRGWKGFVEGVDSSLYTATPLARYNQLSPGSSRLSWSPSPVLKPPTNTGAGFTPGLLSVTVTFRKGTLPGLVTL